MIQLISVQIGFLIMNFVVSGLIHIVSLLTKVTDIIFYPVTQKDKAPTDYVILQSQ